MGANLSRWILRDLSGQVLREYINNQGTWSLAEDYFYRDSLLLAAEPPAGRRHFHLDHLGTWSRKRGSAGCIDLCTGTEVLVVVDDP